MTLELTPLTPPTGLDGWNDGVTDVSWATADGDYLALTDGSDKAFGFKRTGDSLATVFTFPTPLKARYLDWDPSGTYLAIGQGYGGTNNKVRWFKRTGDTLAELTSPAHPSSDTPTSARYAAWDPTGTYLAVAHPYTVIYKRTGDTLVALREIDPAEWGQTAWTDNQPAWDPTGTYLAIPNALPYAPVGLLKRTGDTFAATAFDIFPPDVQGQAVAWHPSGNLLALTTLDPDGLKVWLLERSGDSLAISDSMALGSGAESVIAFHPISGLLAVVTSRADPTPYDAFQDIVFLGHSGGDLFAAQSVESPNSGGSYGKGLNFSADGTRLAYGHFTASEDDLAALTWWSVEEVTSPSPGPGSSPALTMIVTAPAATATVKATLDESF